MPSPHNPKMTTNVNRGQTAYAHKIKPTEDAAYQNLAYSDVINIEIAGLWEDRYCTKRGEKGSQKNTKAMLKSRQSTLR